MQSVISSRSSSSSSILSHSALAGNMHDAVHWLLPVSKAFFRLIACLAYTRYMMNWFVFERHSEVVMSAFVSCLLVLVQGIYLTSLDFMQLSFEHMCLTAEITLKNCVNFTTNKDNRASERFFLAKSRQPSICDFRKQLQRTENSSEMFIDIL